MTLTRSIHNFNREINERGNTKAMIVLNTFTDEYRSCRSFRNMEAGDKVVYTYSKTTDVDKIRISIETNK